MTDLSIRRLQLAEIAAQERTRRAGRYDGLIASGTMSAEGAAWDAALWNAITGFLDGSARTALMDNWPDACVATRRAARTAMAAHLKDPENTALWGRAGQMCRLAGHIASTADLCGQTGMVDTYLDDLKVLAESFKSEERKAA